MNRLSSLKVAMYYYLIIALQAFCIYHCYTKQNNYYWIFAHIFLPIVGSLGYLFMNVIQKKDMEKAQEDIVNVLNPTKKIKNLEKKLNFSETFENKVALADAYMDNNMFEEALKHYKSSLVDMFKNDFYVLSRIQEAYFNLDEMDRSLEFAEKIYNHKDFSKSQSNFLYAKALDLKGDFFLAEQHYSVFDAPYNYYGQRLEYARFLIRINKKEKAQQLLTEMANEAENMSKESYKANRAILKMVKEELAQFT